VKKNPLQDLINKIVWKNIEANIEYIDRYEGIRIKRLDPMKILKAGTSFIILKDGSMIPYHRITTIEFGGKIFYSKRDDYKKWTGKNTS